MIKNFVKKYGFIIIVIVLSILLFVFKFRVYDNYINGNKTENLTVKLRSDEDFLNWFSCFINLYNEKKDSSYPDLIVNEDDFKIVNEILNNEEEVNFYKDGKYYISDNETLELDVGTRSFRYTLFDNNKVNYIIEVRLINGKYYIQSINKNNIYRIIFNKDDIEKMVYKNDKEVKIGKSIYGEKEFSW